MTSPLLALDLGGTKLLTALVSPRGRILAHAVTATRAMDGPEGLVKQLRHALKELAGIAGPKVGQPPVLAAAVAGIIDVERGVVTFSPNLWGQEHVPLRDILQEGLGMPAVLINDATAAAFGEHRLGAGRGTRHMVFITVSTGIGGGIICNGRLYEGASGAAGEVGHMMIDPSGPRCGCGNYGCLEALASGSAIARESRDRIALGVPSSLAAIIRKGRDLDAEDVGAAASAGDPLAMDVVARAADYLGLGLANLVNIFNPEAIVIGGGVAKMGEMLLGPAARVMRQKAFKLPGDAVKVLPAALGGNAGIVGAALWASEKLRRKTIK